MMSNLKLLMRLLLNFLTLAVIIILIFIGFGLPIISGYGANVLCSDVFVSGRNADEVIKNDLSVFPFNLGHYQISYTDSSVKATVFGLAFKIAKYRKGFGAALIYPSSTNKSVRKERNAINEKDKNSPWPYGEAVDSGIELKDTSFQNIVRYCFENRYQTRALLIIKSGKIIFEKYAIGISADTRLAGWSMAKSITNALLGILVKDRLLDTAARPVFPEWKADSRSQISLSDMMHMSSGLQWLEMYEGPSDVTRMLFRENDMAGYALKKNAVYPAGKTFEYSSGTANLLSLKMRMVLGDAAYYEFPYKKLFGKIGMNHTLLETDGSGTFVGSSFCYATARDFGRFGLLYLNDGKWNGEEILPKGWVKFSTNTVPERYDKRWGNYGALWWVNKGDSKSIRKRRYPNVPEDCFSAMGYEGQSIWIIPSRQTVVVRLSNEHFDKLDGNKLLEGICNLR
ncbi:MAG: serine hydrolase [Ginsengibacter sp.]